MEIVPTLVPISKLRDYTICNPAGESLGQVQNFMVDVGNGRIAMVIVAFGGTLGLTDKWYAVPWDAMQWSPETKRFILNVSKESIKKVPGLGRKWEEELNLAALNQVYDAFGCRPYWATTQKETTEQAYPRVIGKDTVVS